MTVAHMHLGLLSRLELLTERQTPSQRGHNPPLIRHPSELLDTVGIKSLLYRSNASRVSRLQLESGMINEVITPPAALLPA